MIAGLPKAPSAYNPINNPQRAKIRRDWILSRMKKLGFITTAEFATHSAQPVTARYHGTKLELNAGHAAEIARNLAVEKLGLKAYTDGFTIKTTIDSHQQETAQRAIENGLFNYDLRHGHRGPEQTFPIEQRDQWPAMINQLRPINGLEPGVITAFSYQPIHAQENPQEQQEINEEQTSPLDEEERQALQQWLRRVPDDPGGLLRRKFQQQHEQRVREGKVATNDTSGW